MTLGKPNLQYDIRQSINDTWQAYDLNKFESC